MPYPRWLEQWWLDRARRLLKKESFAACQATLEAEIQRLSDHFTTGRRAGFGEYGRDEQLLLAYGLFYFPQTFTRIRFPLREALGCGWRPAPEGRLRILDLGAGFGGASLGASLLVRETTGATIETLAVDRSGSSLAALRELCDDNRSHLDGIETGTERGDLKTWFNRSETDRAWGLILASFSLGEAFFGEPAEGLHRWVNAALERLDEGGLVLITEPALRETAEQVERLRDRIAEEGIATILAPCPHHFRCPLLAGGKFWCHEVRRWNPPDSLSFLNRRLFRSVEELKFSFLALQKKPRAPVAALAPGEPIPMRLISPVSTMKGRLLWTGCTADGERREFEIQTRGLTREEQAAILEIKRGDWIEVAGSRPLGSGERLRVDSRENIQRRSREASRGCSEGCADSPR